MNTSGFEGFFRTTYADSVRALVRSGVDPESAAAWVRRVATNRAIDLFRSQGRHRDALPALEVEARLRAGAAATSSPVESDEGSLTAYAELLPTQQRRVVELCYGRDMTAEQAAAEMGISAGAVRFHLSRARTRLRPAISADRRDEEVV